MFPPSFSVVTIHLAWSPQLFILPLLFDSHTHTEGGVECGGHGWHGNHLLIYISHSILYESS